MTTLEAIGHELLRLYEKGQRQANWVVQKKAAWNALRPALADLRAALQQPMRDDRAVAALSRLRELSCLSSTVRYMEMASAIIDEYFIGSTSALAQPQEREPECFPAHRTFAPPCNPIKRGTLASTKQLHHHCPECGRCYDCSNAPRPESAPQPRCTHGAMSPEQCRFCSPESRWRLVDSGLCESCGHEGARWQLAFNDTGAKICADCRMPEPSQTPMTMERKIDDAARAIRDRVRPLLDHAGPRDDELAKRLIADELRKHFTAHPPALTQPKPDYGDYMEWRDTDLLTYLKAEGIAGLLTSENGILEEIVHRAWQAGFSSPAVAPKEK